MTWTLEDLNRSFKAYDIRGRIPEDLDDELAYAIGQAYATLFKPQKVVVGRDIRKSSLSFSRALSKGLNDSGVDVIDIGLCGTEQVYFATFFYELAGGLMVTASHNPANYNGIKCVREKAIPIHEDAGLRDMAKLIVEGKFAPSARKGQIEKREFISDYVRHVLKMIDLKRVKPLKVIFNSGNGVAGTTLDALLKHLPLQASRLFHEADGNFPHGVPNPMILENRLVTAEAVLREGADLGIAWDGDFDRCFFFDEKGQFVDGYYMVGLFAQYFLKNRAGEKIIYDPRLTWNTQERVKAAGGIPLQNKSGHAFMKQRMRAENAIYGGESSAHHYFRDFGYCDSGMIPWLVLVEMLSESGKKLSEWVGEQMHAFPISGEINRKVKDGKQVMRRICERYESQAIRKDEMDGLSFEFSTWRFNLRMSNTEPLIRLNVETRGNSALLQEKTADLLSQMESQA